LRIIDNRRRRKCGGSDFRTHAPRYRYLGLLDLGRRDPTRTRYPHLYCGSTSKNKVKQLAICIIFVFDDLSFSFWQGYLCLYQFPYNERYPPGWLLRSEIGQWRASERLLRHEPMHAYEYKVVISGSRILRRIFNIEDSCQLSDCTRP
jgi:hypothetical protein